MPVMLCYASLSLSVCLSVDFLSSLVHCFYTDMALLPSCETG